MPHVPDFQKGSIGSILRIVVTDDGGIFDMSLSTKHDFVLKNPLGVRRVVSTVFTPLPDGAGDGSDGSLDFETIDADDWDEAGSWEVQVDIDQPSSAPPFIGPSSVVRFRVKDNL